MQEAGIFKFCVLASSSSGNSTFIGTDKTRILLDCGLSRKETFARLASIGEDPMKLDAIFITHEHSDHYHLDSLKTLLLKNPEATIFANTSVSELLTKENITHQVILEKQTIDFSGVTITGHGMYHAEIHRSIPLSANTGFMIDKKLFYPGDAFIDPGEKVVS